MITYIIDDRETDFVTVKTALDLILTQNKEQFKSCSIGEQKHCEYTSGGEANAPAPVRYSRHVYGLSEADRV